MGPSTAVGLVIALVAVLPGAVYVWAYERESTARGVTLADRTLRFIAASVVLHLLLAWPAYGLYRWAIYRTDVVGAGQFAVLWLCLLLITLVPYGTGTVLGGLYATRSTRNGWQRLRRLLSADHEARLLRVVLGRDPAPRAWDQLFSERPTAYLRVRTTDGRRVAGQFAEASYAGGFPHDADLLLEQAWEVDQETGVLGDRTLGYPVYMPASSIAWVEVIVELDEGASGEVDSSDG